MTPRQKTVFQTWARKLLKQKLTDKNKAERITIAFGFLLQGGIAL